MPESCTPKTRESLIEQALSARSLAAIQAARQGILDWMAAHPEDLSIEFTLDALYRMELAVRAVQEDAPVAVLPQGDRR